MPTNEVPFPPQAQGDIPLQLTENANATPHQKVPTKPLCRNVIIYGDCKFESTCHFTHPPKEPMDISDKSTMNRTSLAKGLAGSVHAPEFVPRKTAQLQSNDSQPSSVNSSDISFDANLQVQTLSVAMPGPGVAYNSHHHGHHERKPALRHGLYTGIVPNVSSRTSSVDTSTRSLFIPEHVRKLLTKRNEAGQDERDPTLPERVHQYTALQRLEGIVMGKGCSDHFGCETRVYKATNVENDHLYTLVRFKDIGDQVKVDPNTIDQWRSIQNSSIVLFEDAFITNAFGDTSLVLVYHYYLLAKTAHDTYFSRDVTDSSLPPEDILWTYVSQITSALKSIHNAGLAARSLHMTKLLMTDRQCVRLNCVGAFDFYLHDDGKSIARHQQEDLLAFGRLILALGCKSLAAAESMKTSIQFIQGQYSVELSNTILYLLSKPSPQKTIDQVVVMVAPFLMHEHSKRLHFSDFLQTTLTKELEHGRNARWLVMMNHINERPRFDMVTDWSETGDRYIVKLFRDYVFHQVNECGEPTVNLAHVLKCLCKLDAGVDEKIMLMSRDEQSCLVVSYKEIRNCILSSFNELSPNPPNLYSNNNN